MKAIKAILFDAYGTLFTAGRENIVEISKAIGDEYKIDANDFYAIWSAKYLSLEERFSSNFMTILDANHTAIMSAFNMFKLPLSNAEYWISQLSERWSMPELFLDVPDAIASLRKLTEIIGIISNADIATLRSAVEETHLPVDYVLTSEMTRIYKPDPGIFLHALQDLSLKTEECIYVGNSDVDIEGANRANICMVHINREGRQVHIRHKPHSTISSMQELIQVLLLLQDNRKNV